MHALILASQRNERQTISVKRKKSVLMNELRRSNKIGDEHDTYSTL
jgi:hypothetical protein